MKQYQLSEKQKQILNDCVVFAGAKAFKMATGKSMLAEMVGEMSTYLTLINKRRDFERWRKDIKAGENQLRIESGDEDDGSR